MIKVFKKTGTDNGEQAKLEENIQQALIPVLSKQILDGVLLPNIALTTGQTTVVAHKLGRELRGWYTVRLRGNAHVWDSQDSNLLKSKNLHLQCSANVTVDLWCF